jgi:GTPase SAR1 family protein
MLVGQGRAGKTAVANSMMGKGYQGNTASTIGTEKFERSIVCGKVGRTQSVLKECKRSYIELEQMVANSIFLLRKPAASSIAPDSKSNVGVDVADSIAFVTSLITEERTSMMDQSLMKPYEKIGTECHRSSAVEETVSKRLALGDIDNAMVKQYSENISIDSELVISLYDFGGQDIFNVLHPFFMSRYGVYVVVFDMELFLSKDEEKRESCMKHLKFWMNSIVMHTYDEVSGKTAPVAIVGTRKDKVSRFEDHERISLMLYKMFCSSSIWSSLLLYIEDTRSLNFFPVNNTKWFSMTVALKRLLDSFVCILDKSDFVKKPVSLVWIKILDEMKAKNTSFLGISEVEEMCKVYCLSSNEIAEMLTFLYEMGILIWINEEKLRDIVILDPIEYFVKPVTMIICKHIATKDDPYHTVHCEKVHKACRDEWSQDWFHMLEFGLVSERLAVRLLGSICESGDHIDKILLLMERYGFLTRISALVPVQYIIPALLPENPRLLLHEKSDLLMGKLISRLTTRLTLLDSFSSRVSFTFTFGLPAATSILLREDAAFFSFEDVKQSGFLPSGLFTRFITAVLEECELGANFNSESLLLFRDKVQVCYRNRNIKLSHLMEQNMIQVEVEEEDSGSSHALGGEELSSLHSNLCRILSSSIKQCFKNLQFITVLPVSAELLSGASSSSASSASCQGFLSLPAIQRFPVSSPRKHFVSFDGCCSVSINHDIIQKEYPLWIISQSPPVPPLPPTPVFCTDVFLSHDWGKDNTMNHEKVKIINEALQKKGLITWFDEEKMKGDLIDRMTEGIEKTKCVLVFVTENYRNKVNGLEKRDNCYLEFSHATFQKGPQKMISIVMEKEMRNTKDWKGQIGVALQKHIYYDFSEIDFVSLSSSSLDLEDENSEFKKKIDKLVEEILEMIKN